MFLLGYEDFVDFFLGGGVIMKIELYLGVFSSFLCILGSF